MKIEVLLATMFFENETETLLDYMNLRTDAVVGNQCDQNKNEEFQYKGNKVTVLSRNERGVGKNRNEALFKSDADIVLFADNDVKYYDNYADEIKDYYEANPDADVVIFNFKQKRRNGPLTDVHKKNKRARLFELTGIGTWAITARRKNILKNRISFSLLFGGGAKYSAGEDSLFLFDCYRRGLKIYFCSKTIGCVVHRESTWYEGITEKLIYDRGAFFAASSKWYMFLIMYHAIKHRKMYQEYGYLRQVVRLMNKGAREYLSEK